MAVYLESTPKREISFVFFRHDDGTRMVWLEELTTPPVRLYDEFKGITGVAELVAGDWAGLRG